MKLDQDTQAALLKTLEQRFEKNIDRHDNLSWLDIQKKLEANPKKLWSLSKMEETGGEPDVVALGESGDEITFVDCSRESPKGRRSVCYDRDALESRKKFKPKTSAEEMAMEMGVEMLSEEQYFDLQKLGEFDTKTSSWLKTPDEVRELGGAIFGDYRFGRVFIYHNGAESYYGARGFRGILKI
ncbi:DUF4256 domain-containing protein [Halocola ammonii]